jgi:hypothetical protein
MKKLISQMMKWTTNKISVTIFLSLSFLSSKFKTMQTFCRTFQKTLASANQSWLMLRVNHRFYVLILGILTVSESGLWPIIFFRSQSRSRSKIKKGARSLSRSQFYLMIAVAVAIFFAIATRWRSAFQNSAVSKHPLKTALWIYCTRYKKE